MEKNQIIGFILIFATLIFWTIWTAPSEQEIADRKRVQDSIEALKNVDTTAALSEETKQLAAENVATATSTLPAISDSAAMVQNQAVYGVFAPAASGQESIEVLENDVIKIEINTKGGNIVGATLKEHYTSVLGKDGKEIRELVELLSDEKNKFSYNIPMANLPTGVVATKDLYFQPSNSGNSISLTATASNGAAFVQKYTLDEEGYGLDYDVQFVNFDKTIKAGESGIPLEWTNYLPKLEKSEQFEQRYSTVYYKEADEDDADYCNCMKDALEEFPDENLDWVSHSNQFFNSSLIARTAPFKSGELETKMLDLKADEELKYLRSDIVIPFTGSANETFNMQMYIGPNEFKDLKAYDIALEEIIPFGNSIFGTINRWVIRPFFNFLSQFISSKGLVIIILIFLIKMALYPLMYKQLHSQALMGALKPQMAHLNDKFKDEPQKKQVETMKIYREYGVSPFGGCFPMLFTMPIWYALFRFFPASITFRDEPFLWASDLSSYDAFFSLPFEIPFIGSHLSLFTILWAVSTLVYTFYNTRHMDMSANPAMKYVQYLMPVMFLGFFNSYASGLTCYMLFSNLINIGQTVVTKKFVFKDEKLQAELNRKKAKPKKKSGFAERLEEAMKQQQQQQGKGKGKKK